MARGHGRKRRGHAAEHDNDERWLLTYADMITLLMALFMVLFSISSVNISKYRTLQLALKAAFSGDILPGGKSIEQPGASANSSRAPTTIDTPAIVRLTPQCHQRTRTRLRRAVGQRAVAGERTERRQRAPRACRSPPPSRSRPASSPPARAQPYAARHGFAKSVQSPSNSAAWRSACSPTASCSPPAAPPSKSQGQPLLTEIAALLNIDHVHPIAIEGNTDNVPITGGAFPSNWELSTARASTVVRFLIAKGVDSQRLSATGYAEQHPIATNSTAAGRALNRRVEIVLQRLY